MSSLSQRQRQYLDAMGIEVWLSRSGSGPAAAMDVTGEVEVPAPAAVDSAALADAGRPDWEALRARVSACRSCAELADTRKQTVFGVGDEQADWMIIGEAPGADEDRLGEPFVGRAGQLLNAMLAAVGLGRKRVYIANILKCHPPRNRDPLPQEAAACAGFLERQIALVDPKLIIVVGRIAAHNLLNTDTPIGRLRGKVHHLGPERRPVVVTYHPAYLLRKPQEKAKVWQDLQLALSVHRPDAGAET